MRDLDQPLFDTSSHSTTDRLSTTALRRLAAVAAIATAPRVGQVESRQLVASWWEQPPCEPTEIVPGLHQGGTEDDDVLSCHGDDFRRRGSYPFDVVITLYASAQPAPWGVEELRFGFLDAQLRGAQVAAIVRAARFAYERWLDGAEVLIRCQAGMNRSGLVMALVLVMAGLTPGQAIDRIRQQRGSSCLFNEDFVEWLENQSEAVVAAGDARAGRALVVTAPVRALQEAAA